MQEPQPTSQNPNPHPQRLPLALATWLLIGIVLLLVVVLLVVKVTRGSTAPAAPAVSLAPAPVVQGVASVPATAFDLVGAPAPAGGSRPQVLHGQPVLRTGSRVEVVLVSSEFCPYCAAEQWAVVTALSRFGHFAKLAATSSSDSEVFPGIPTLSLSSSSSYTSPVVSLSAVEEFGPRPSKTAPAGFPRIHALDALQRTLLNRQDRPPLAATPGELPFLDVANQLLMIGPGIDFSPSVLSGLSLGAVASDLHQPTSPVARAVLGAANDISAAVCAADGAKPASVCTSSGIESAAASLGLQH